MLSRRILLGAALGGTALLPMVARQSRASIGPITIYDPIGPGSVMHRSLTLLAPPFGKGLGTTASVQILAGFAPATAAMLAGPADGSRLMGRTGTGTALAQLREPADAVVHHVKPIAKITAGMSMALIVAQDSPLKSFADFAGAAKKRRLKIAHFVDPQELPQIAIAMVRRQLGVKFTPVLIAEWKDAVAAVKGGAADASVLLTDSLEIPAAAGLRLLCTFGGARSEAFPKVPTFRELTQPKNSAFTTALGLFGATAIPPATVDKLGRSIVAAGAEVAGAARRMGLPLEVSGAAVMQTAMARDVRIVKSLEPWMRDD